MSAYNKRYNTDNIVLRNIIIGVMAELQDTIHIYHYHADEDQMDYIDIPVLYSMSGQEQFLQDEFVYDAIGLGKAKGDYERVPRMVIDMQGIAINSGELTNKYTDVTFTLRHGENLKTVKTKAIILPLSLNFNTTVVADSVNEMLKITESIFSNYYKAKMFYIDFGGYSMQIGIEFPEDYNHEKPIDFSFMSGKKNYQIQFTMNVKAFYPVFANGLTYSDIDYLINYDGYEHFKDILDLSYLGYDYDHQQDGRTPKEVFEDNLENTDIITIEDGALRTGGIIEIFRTSITNALADSEELEEHDMKRYQYDLTVIHKDDAGHIISERDYNISDITEEMPLKYDILDDSIIAE